MTPEVAITRRGSQLHDDSEHDKQHMSSLQQEHGDLTSLDVDGAGVPSTTENHRSWALVDIEGVVMEVLEDVMWGSAGQAIEKVVSDRLFGYVCAWGSTILEEVLASAIAPTGDVAVDSSDSTILNNSRVLLGRSELALESLDPPKDCPVDDSYQRRQVPVRAAKRNHYDSESLHHAVKAAARSHTHPASITSSRLTMKSKMRRKQHGTGASQVELSGPQPGVPFSTEVHENHHSGRQRILSPRKVKVISQPIGTENATEYRDAGGTPPLWDPHFNSNTAGAGLQLNIDTESIRQGNSVSSTKARRSPPPLSRSPSSIASARRRPHPPGSAQSAQASKTICFGEREEEVKVEYAVQKSPPRRSSASLKGVLPDIDSGRMTPRPSVLYQAFGAIPNNHAVDEDIDKSSLFDEDPLDQHFHAMPLSPGVKLRAGDESNDGPELPLFASRMCRSTFLRMETCTLPTGASDPSSHHSVVPMTRYDDTSLQQPRKGTFLTETAWDFSFLSTNCKRSIGDQVIATQGHAHYVAGNNWNESKAEDISFAEPIGSCSCGSSSSLTLFRKQSKVQRPCRSCSNPNADQMKTDVMNFTNLVKQRAFHLKPPCLPTSSSPSKRAPGASPRRVTSAPACSPLARRNLLLSKTASQPANKKSG